MRSRSTGAEGLEAGGRSEEQEAEARALKRAITIENSRQS